MDDDIMTTVQAAEFLGIAPASVARLIRRGQLKGKRFGKSWMVYRSSVEDFLQKTEGKSKFDRTRGEQNK
jgi:excisionase family DNA binding protein